jgi:hypothetical protein
MNKKILVTAILMIVIASLVSLDTNSTAAKSNGDTFSAIGKVTAQRRLGFFDLKLIRSRPIEGGRRIVGVCDRPIGFLEAYYSGRSLDNKFGIVILDLKQDKKGKEQGVGELIYAATVTVLEGNKVDVENLGIDPVKLLGVRKF